MLRERSRCNRSLLVVRVSVCRLVVRRVVSVMRLWVRLVAVVQQLVWRVQLMGVKILGAGRSRR